MSVPKHQRDHLGRGADQADDLLQQHRLAGETEPPTTPRTSRVQTDIQVEVVVRTACEELDDDRAARARG